MRERESQVFSIRFYFFAVSVIRRKANSFLTQTLVSVDNTHVGYDTTKKKEKKKEHYDVVHTHLVHPRGREVGYNVISVREQRKLASIQSSRGIFAHEK